VAAVFTGPALVQPIGALCRELLPEYDVENIVDDSLLRDVIAAGHVTPAVRRRMFRYYEAGLDMGAALIFNTCSSVGEVASAARDIIDVPIVKIDDAMASQAVQLADSIGVLATVPTTLGPTVRLLEAKAREQGKTVRIQEGLAGGAFQALLGGDPERHDAIVLDAAARVAEGAEVIVLAQASMARMEAKLAAHTGRRVLSSARSGVESVRAHLAKLAERAARA
jgi:Asp/Glu/hydantoin racemase